MKKLLLLFLMLMAACQEEEFNADAAPVDQFVKSLRSGEYNQNQPIPNFQPEQISELLRYANNLEEILAFPANPVSSFLPQKLRLGECLLWTIESIRVSHGQELTSIERYPSLNPILINSIAQRNEGQAATDEEVLEAVQAYSDWWNDPASFEQKRTINPLANTSLTWR
ncbi:MAG: DUF4943 family protein [Bacteroidota bacterium]